LGLDNTR
jgi:hypothetical protein